MFKRFPLHGYKAIPVVAVFFAILSIAPFSHAAKRALIIGINEYKYNNEYLREKGRSLNLEGCVDDARDVERAIIENLGFVSSEIKLLTNEKATLESVERGITEWLIKGTQPGDTVFFYYSGHGFLMFHPDGNRTSLCPYDSNPFTLDNLLTADRLGKLFAGLKGRTLVAVVDSCHSAAAMRGEALSGIGKHHARARQFPVEQIYPSAGRTRNLTIFEEVLVDKIFLAASGVKEMAWELPIAGRVRGVFTYGLVQELQKSEGNIDPETVKDSLVRFIQKEELPQTPQLKSQSLLAKRNLRDLFVSNPQAQLAGLDDPNPPFPVEVWVTQQGKKNFRIGEKLVFTVQSGRKGFLYMVDIDPQNKVTVLFPNYWDRNNHIRAGEAVTVPGPNFQAEFIAAEPLGRDTIIAVVSSRRWKEFETLDINAKKVMAILNEPQVTNIVAEALTRSATRGVRIRPKSGEDAASEEHIWALGRVQIAIQP